MPPKEAVYSKLNMRGIFDADCVHAQNVWTNCINQKGDRATLGDYHDTYIATDVLLHADVFENFRDVFLENYKRDTAHFYTSPNLAWRAVLKPAGIKLELLTDSDMLLMFEASVEGSHKQYIAMPNPTTSIWVMSILRTCSTSMQTTSMAAP